jgi:hypothetical protein
MKLENKYTLQHMSMPSRTELSTHNKDKISKRHHHLVELDSRQLPSTCKFQHTKDHPEEGTFHPEAICKILRLARIKDFNRHKNS